MGERWLVFNVGCIECGVSSKPVGVFGSEAEAERAASVLRNEMAWRHGGQNDFEVFYMPEGVWVDEDYRDALAATPEDGKDG